MRWTRPAGLLAATLLLAGCASVTPPTPPPPQALLGQWLFVAVEQAPADPHPPRFDVMEFQDGGALTLRSVIGADSFPSTYTLHGDTLDYEFRPAGLDHAVHEKVQLASARDGRLLILHHVDTDLAFSRPADVLPNDVAGDYEARHGNDRETMRLDNDGSITLLTSKVRGHYRLWNSPLGPVMTQMMLIPNAGWFCFSFEMKRSEKGLTLTPIVNGRVLNAHALSWTQTAPR